MNRPVLKNFASADDALLETPEEAADRVLSSWPGDCRMLVVGDSGARFWTGRETIDAPDSLPNVVTHNVGPFLAHNLAAGEGSGEGRRRVFCLLDRLAERHGLPEFLMFCFGRVDLRAHVVRRAVRAGLSLDAVVGAVVDRYVSFLRDTARYGRRVLVWEPSAAQWEGARQNPLIPTFGTEQERNAATILFHHRLGEAARADPGLFTPVGILSETLLPGNRTQRTFFYDTIHLAGAAMPFALAALERAVGWRPAWEMPTPAIDPGGFRLPELANIAPKAQWRMLPSNTGPDADIANGDREARRPARTPPARNPKCHVDLRTTHAVREIRISFANAEDAANLDTIGLMAESRGAYAPVTCAEIRVEQAQRVYRFDDFECRIMRIEKRGESVVLELCGIEILGLSFPVR